jgi:iron complex outermembrane receptor protein
VKRQINSARTGAPAQAFSALAAALLLATGPALAQSTATHTFHLDTQPLSRTLLSIAAQSGVPLSYDPQLVAHLTAAPVNGELSAQAAIAQALKGTGLEVATTDNRALTVRRAQAAASTEDAGPKAPPTTRRNLAP